MKSYFALIEGALSNFGGRIEKDDILVAPLACATVGLHLSDSQGLATLTTSVIAAVHASVASIHSLDRRPVDRLAQTRRGSLQSGHR